MHFKNNQKLTIISIGELLGNTIKREVKLTRVVDGRQAYVVKGKRKEYILNNNHTLMIFEGWGIPVTVDTTTTDGNYNFITNKPSELKKYLVSNNINKYFNRWYIVMYDAEADQECYTMLFNVIELESLSNSL